MSKSTSNTAQAFWVALGNLSSFSLAIVSAAILSRFFEKAEYGTYKQITFIYNTLLVVFSVGLPKAFSYFLPKYDLAEGKSIVVKLTKNLFFLGVIFSLFLFFFSGFISEIFNNPQLKEGLELFAVVPVLFLPTLGIESLFSSYRKTIFIAIYNTISRFILLASILIPVIFINSSFIYAIYGWIVGSSLSLLLALYFKTIPFRGIGGIKTSLSNAEILKYSFPLVLSTIGGILIQSSNQFYISRYYGVEKFAEFANGFIQLPFVGMVTASASVVLLPLYSKMYSREVDKLEIIRLWNSSLRKSALIIYPLVIFAMFNARDIIVFLYSSRYENSVIFFQIILFLNLFNIIMFMPLILAMGETGFYAKIHILFAIILWSVQLILVKLNQSAEFVVSFFVLVNILLALINLLFITKKLGESIQSLVPLDTILKVLLNTILSGISVFYFFKSITLTFFSPLAKMMISAILFSVFLLFFSFLFKTDYHLLSIKQLKKIQDYFSSEK